MSYYASSQFRLPAAPPAELRRANSWVRLVRCCNGSSFDLSCSPCWRGAATLTRVHHHPPLTPASSIARPGAPDATATSNPSAHFVGSIQCIRCHSAEGEKWRGSHHDRAMEEANSESVEARFDGSVVQHADQLWRFVQNDGDDSFVIEVESEGQSKERLTVAYTFGAEPLQQYLVTRPDGRLQSAAGRLGYAFARAGWAAMDRPSAR